jgi:HlyD family secretion protein
MIISSISSDVALQVAQKVFAVAQAQFALVDAQNAVNDAQTAVNDAQTAVDDAKAAVYDAQLDVNDAQSAVSDAQDALDEAQSKSPIITAPFDGFISSVKVSGGDEVYKGTVAMVIADPTQFSAKILVTEDDIFSVKLGGEANVTLNALSDYTFPAQVTKISPTATVSSGVVNYSVTVNLTSLTPITALQTSTSTAGTGATSQMPALSGNRTMPSGMPSGFTPPSASGDLTAPSGTLPGTSTTTATAASTTQNITLKDGLSAVVNIISQKKDNILLVPSKAITRQSGKSTVQVVTASGTETREVQTGMTDGSYTEITSGLSEGEKLVIKTTTSSSSSSSSKTVSTHQQLQSISGGGPGGPPGGGF